jgi:hypothetical protein
LVALPTDPLYSAKLRIERAEELLDQLFADQNRFFEQATVTEVVELDADETHELYKLAVSERFPIKWRVLATEIVLRAALDHAAFATFFLRSGGLDTKYAAFPFGKSASELDKIVKGRSRDCPKEIQTLLRSFNAFEGGNDLLYTLSKLANASKHGLITFIGGALAGGQLTMKGPKGGFDFDHPVTWDGEKNEIVYARVKGGTKFEQQGKLQVYPLIPGTEHLPGITSTGVLSKIGEEVARVVGEIEHESRRIGILC